MTVIPLSVVVVAMVDGGAVKEAESVAHGGITIAAGADGRHWAGASQNGRSLPELSHTERVPVPRWSRPEMGATLKKLCAKPNR